MADHHAYYNHSDAHHKISSYLCTSNTMPTDPPYQTLQPGQSSSKVILPGRTLLLPVGDYEFTNMHNGQRCKWFVHIKGMLSLI